MLLVKTYVADVLDSNLWEKMKIYSSVQLCVALDVLELKQFCCLSMPIYYSLHLSYVLPILSLLCMFKSLSVCVFVYIYIHRKI